MLSKFSAYIQVSGADAKEVKADSQVFSHHEDGITTSSASGILWAREQEEDFILVPAAFLIPFLRAECRHDLGKCNHSNLSYNVRIKVMMGSQSRDAKLMGIFPLLDFKKSVDRIGSGNSSWVCGWKVRNYAQEWSLGWHFLAVLCCKPNFDQESFPTALQAALNNAVPESRVHAGDSIWLCGNPFGCLALGHLMSHHSVGMISSTPRQGGESAGSMYFADVQCLPGMEGSPVFKDDRLIGMLMTPISHRKFDAEVPVIAVVQSLITGWSAWLTHQLRRVTSQNGPLPKSLDSNLFSKAVVDDFTTERKETYSSDNQAMQIHSNHVHSQHGTQVTDALESKKPKTGKVKKLRQSVVAIQNHGSWASGVLVGGRFVLTVAHALSYTDRSHDQGPFFYDYPQVVRVGVLLDSEEIKWHFARIVYVFQEGLDIAVLCLEGESHQHQANSSAVLSPRHICLGDPVFVVGYANFSPELGLGPSVASGNIAKVLRRSSATGHVRGDTDVLLMTTANVHPGASGGAVFSEEGDLVGIVTSNTKLSSTGTSIPRLNYSISRGVLNLILFALDQPRPPVDSLKALDGQLAKWGDLWTLTHVPTTLDDSRKIPTGSEKLVKWLEGANILEILGTPSAKL